MKKLLLIIPIIFVLASTPELLAVRQSKIFLDLEAPYRVITHYIDKISSGTIFNFTYSGKSWNFFDIFPLYFRTTLFYSWVSIAIGLSAGTIAGLFLSNGKLQKVRAAISFLRYIPDFVLIVFLQLIIIFIYKNSGLRFALTATAGNSRALLLPILSLSLFPLIHTMNSVAIECNKIRSKTYILFARSKGLSRNHIFFKHILPGVVPVIKSELPVITGGVIGSLFICERIYNIPGITRFLFSILGGEFHTIVNTIFALLILFIIIYLFFLALLSIVRRLISHV